MANTKVYQSRCEGFPLVTAYMVFGHSAKFIQRIQEDFSASLRRWGSKVPFAIQEREVGRNRILPHVSGLHPFCCTTTNTNPSSWWICPGVSFILLTTDLGTSSTHCNWGESESWNEWTITGCRGGLDSGPQEARSFADVYQRVASEMQEFHLFSRLSSIRLEN